jgi:hypothetical protein
MGVGPVLLAGWRRPQAEGQTPYNLPTVQCLLLWVTLSFCIILGGSALGFKPSGDELFLQWPRDELDDAVTSPIL